MKTERGAAANPSRYPLLSPNNFSFPSALPEFESRAGRYLDFRQIFMKLVCSIFGSTFLIFCFAGCDANPNLPVNEDVVVQFDRSALGASANLPISPRTESINGAETAIRGKLLQVSPEWILLEQRTSQSSGTDIKKFWIQRNKILLIQTRLTKGNGIAGQGAAANP
jgi:hypothetical protein